MTEVKQVYFDEKSKEANTKKRYSAYMKKLNDLAKKNEKKQKREEK